MVTNNSELGRLNFFYNSIYGEDIEMSSLSRRIKLQKLIYILGLKGINFNYAFMWYVYGPYSRALSDDGYRFVNNGNIISDYTPKPNEKNIIDKMKQARPILDDVDKTEIIASFLFLKENYKTDDLALKQLESLKPRFEGKTQQVLQEWDRLTDHTS